MELVSRRAHEATRFVMRIQQRLDALAKIVVGTGLQQEGFPFRWVGSGNRLVEEHLFGVGIFVHGASSILVEGLVIPRVSSIHYLCDLSPADFSKNCAITSGSGS